MSTEEHATSRRFRVVVRTNPGVVLPPGSVWSLTVGQADDPPLQVGVLTGYEESSWSAPVARVLYLVVDLAAASLEDAVIEALEAALATVGELLPLPSSEDDGDLEWQAELAGRYATVKPFIEQLVSVVPWGSAAAGCVTTTPDALGSQRDPEPAVRKPGARCRRSLRACPEGAAGASWPAGRWPRCRTGRDAGTRLAVVC